MGRRDKSLQQLHKEAMERNRNRPEEVVSVPLPYRRRHHNRHHQGRNRHHFFTAKSRGGSMAVQNLLLIDIERHKNWHALFGNLGAEQVLALLERVVRAKKQQQVST